MDKQLSLTLAEHCEASMLFRVWSIGIYEALNLMRSKLFLAFIVSAALILSMIHFLGGINNQWVRHAIPSSIPYFTLLYLNFIQSLISIYMASDFYSREQQVNSSELTSIRCFTNLEYLTGKLSAVLIVFLIVNTLILTITLLSNILLLDVPVLLRTYLFYLLLIPFPSVLYICGLTFLAVMIIRHKPFVCFILTIYTIATSLELDLHNFYLFDFMGTHIPFLYSDFVGFGKLFPMLYQRLMYLCIGCACFLLAVPLYHKRRLMQSRKQNAISAVVALGLVATASFFGQQYYKSFHRGVEYRKQITTLYRDYASQSFLSIEKYKLHVDHIGSEIQTRAEMTLENDTIAAIDMVVLSLNPGLHVESLTYHGSELPFTRKLSIIETVLPRTLKQGEQDTLVIDYRGTIDEEACYIDIDEKLRSISHIYMMMAIDKRHAFITPDYVLLTKENLWYPIAGVPPGPEHPHTGSGFSYFDIDVTTKHGLTAISQGKAFHNSNGKYHFITEHPLSQITIIIGDYNKKEVAVDGVEYAVYHKKGHDFFSKHFADIQDKLPGIIRELKQDIEFQLGLDYPFPRFSLIEVPVQFFAYQRDWTLSTGTVQPEQVLVPEKGVLLRGFDLNKSRKYALLFSRSEGLTSAEIQTRMLRPIINRFFFQLPSFQRQKRMFLLNRMKEKRFGLSSIDMGLFDYTYNIMPMFTIHACRLHSEEPVSFSTLLDLYFKSRLTHLFGSMSRLTFDVTFKTSYDIARKALADASLHEISSNPAYADVMVDVLETKSEQFFLNISSHIGKEKFDKFLDNYYNENMFRNVDENEFISAVRESLGCDLTSKLEDFYCQRGLPAYIVSDLRCHEFLDGDRSKYQLMFSISNVGNAGGVTKVSLYPLGKRDNDDVLRRIIHVEPGTKKEIGWVLDERSEDAVIFDTLLSANVPKSFIEHIHFLGKSDNWTPFDGELSMATPIEVIPEGTIIVDNADPGFSIVPYKHTGILRRHFRFVEQKEDETNEHIDFLKAPKRWETVTDFHFYGSGGINRNGCYIRSAKDRQSVCWEAELHEQGDYDVYFHIPDFSHQLYVLSHRPGSWKKIIFNDFHFQIFHEDGVDSIILDVKDAEGGWKYLGTWGFPADRAKISLSNESRGEVVIADAVKWVKR